MRGLRSQRGDVSVDGTRECSGWDVSLGGEGWRVVGSSWVQKDPAGNLVGSPRSHPSGRRGPVRGRTVGCRELPCILRADPARLLVG